MNSKYVLVTAVLLTMAALFGFYKLASKPKVVDVGGEQAINSEAIKQADQTPEIDTHTKRQKSSPDPVDPEVEAALDKLLNDDEISSAYSKILEELLHHKDRKFGIYLTNVDRVIPVLIARLNDPEDISADSARLLYLIVYGADLVAAFGQTEHLKIAGYEKFVAGVAEHKDDIRDAALVGFEKSPSLFARQWLASSIAYCEPNKKGLDILVRGFHRKENSKIRDMIMYGIRYIATVKNFKYFTPEIEQLFLDEYAELNITTWDAALNMLEHNNVDVLETSIEILHRASSHDGQFRRLIQVISDHRERAKAHLPVLEKQVKDIEHSEKKEKLRKLIEEIRSS